MWYLIATSLVLLSLAKLGYCEEGASSEEEPDIVYRPGTGTICPPRAVCADAFNYQQTRNDVTNTMNRVIYNCRCSRESVEVCPVNDAHMLHSSPIHKQYLCRPVATYPKCNLDEPTQVAEEMEENSPDFALRNYFRINCVCPRHGLPVARVRGTLQRATSYTRTKIDYGRFRFFQQFVCRV